MFDFFNKQANEAARQQNSNKKGRKPDSNPRTQHPNNQTIWLGGMRKALKIHRPWAGVLRSCTKPDRSLGGLALPYPPTGPAHSAGRTPCEPSAIPERQPRSPYAVSAILLCRFLFGRKLGWPKNYFCARFFGFLVALARIFDDFGWQNGSPEGRFSVFVRKT